MEAEGRLVLGVTVPAWIFDKYAWTGEIRLPRKGEYFWSELKNQVVLGICDEVSGGPRVILAWRGDGREVHGLRSNVQPGRFKLVKETGDDSESPGEVPEVPAEGEKGPQ